MIFYISLFSIITSLILAIYNWRINKNALFLAGIFIIFSTYGLTHYFTVYYLDVFWTAIFYGNFSPFWYLPGALLYLYTRNTLSDKNTLLGWKDLIHLLPFIIQAINLAPYILSPFSEKMETAELLIADINNVRTAGRGFLLSPTFSFVSRPTLILFYILFSFRLIGQYFNNQRENLPHNKQNRLVFSWLITLNLIALIVAAGFLILTLKLYDQPVNRILIDSEPNHIISGFAFALLPFLLIVLFPQILYGMPLAIPLKKATKKEPISAPISVDPLAETAQVIVDYIQAEKPYLNPDFDLEELSENLEIPKHHIIYCFTILLQKKFTAYRSTMRVEHAKALLKQGSADTLSIDGIGYQSGFPSRSSFFATFKAETGMTPNQFLETINE